MKLVIVMGLTWVIDVLSWCIGGPDYLWYATDLINALQGLFIFIVVGCQPQVILCFFFDLSFHPHTLKVKIQFNTFQVLKSMQHNKKCLFVDVLRKLTLFRC
jgi:hypothetical protein